MKKLVMTAMLGVMALSAAPYRSDRIAIPFTFYVKNVKVQPGVYRVTSDDTNPVATLVNERTGRSLQVVRPLTSRNAGKVELRFEENQNKVQVLVSVR